MTDKQLPSPPVPATVDLTDFDWMPLDVRRLRDSETASKTKAEEFRAAVMLWCAAWHQVPASSLPDDDAELAKFAGYGQMSFSVREFRKVKAGAMRGFVKCSDGRLYHTVIAAKACDSWMKKLEQRHRSECARVAKWNQRHKTDPAQQLPRTPGLVLWITREYPESVYLLSRGTGSDVPEDAPECPDGHGGMSFATSAPSEVRESSSINHSHDGSRGASPPVDNPDPGLRPNGKPGGSGRWRHDPSAALAKLTELGVSTTWSTGKSHAECIERITQELQQRERAH